MTSIERQHERWFKEYWCKTPIEELNEKVVKTHELRYSKPHTEYEYNMKDIKDAYNEYKQNNY